MLLIFSNFFICKPSKLIYLQEDPFNRNDSCSFNKLSNMFFKRTVKFDVKKHKTFDVLKATSRTSPVIKFSYTKSTNKLNL